MGRMSFILLIVRIARSRRASSLVTSSTGLEEELILMDLKK